MNTDEDLCGARPDDPFTSMCDRAPGHRDGHHGLALGDARPDGSCPVIDRVRGEDAQEQKRGRGIRR